MEKKMSGASNTKILQGLSQNHIPATFPRPTHPRPRKPSSNQATMSAPPRAVAAPSTQVAMSTPPRATTMTTSQLSTTQESSKNNHNQKRMSAGEILENYCKKVIASGAYLDSKDIANELFSILPQIKFDDVFREIQKRNRFVDLAVDVYLYSTSIHIFHEMENYILQMYNKWAQCDHNTFEDIGIGSLVQHPKIVEHFKFYSDTVHKNLLPQISIERIIRITNDFINCHPYSELNDKMQEEYSKYLVKKIIKEWKLDHEHVGVSVVYKDIFHKIKQTKKLAIGRVHEEIIAQTTKTIQDSFKSFLGSNAVLKDGSSDFQELITLLPSSFDLPTHYLTLKSIFPRDFSFRGITEHLFSQDAVQSSVLAFFTTPEANVESKSKKSFNNESCVLKCQKETFDTLSESLVLLFLYLWKRVPKDQVTTPTQEELDGIDDQISVESASSNNSLPDISFSLKEYFEANITVDIPLYSLSLLEKKLHQFATNFLVIDGERTSVRCNVDSLFSDVRKSVHRKGSGIKVSRINCISSIVAAIILFRLLSTGFRSGDLNTVSTSIDKSIQTQLPLSALIELSENDDAPPIERIILTSLQSLENTVKGEMNVLSFELLGQGSFLVYMNEYLSKYPATELLDENIKSSISNHRAVCSSAEIKVPATSTCVSINQAIDGIQFAVMLSTAITGAMCSLNSDAQLLDILCQIESSVCLQFGVTHFSDVSQLSFWRFVQEIALQGNSDSCSSEVIMALDQWDQLSKMLHPTPTESSEFSDPSITSYSMPLLRLLVMRSVDLGIDFESNVIDYLIQKHGISKRLSRIIAHDIVGDKSLIDSALPTNVHLHNYLHYNPPSPVPHPEIEQQALSLICTTPLGCSCLEFSQWETLIVPSMPTNRSSIIDFVLENHLKLAELNPLLVFIPIGHDVYPVLKDIPQVDSFSRSYSLSDWNEFISYILAAVTGLTNYLECSTSLHEFFLTLFEKKGLNSLFHVVSATSFLIPDYQIQGSILELYFSILSTCCDIKISTVQSMFMEMLLDGESVSDISSAKKLLGVAHFHSHKNSYWKKLYQYTNTIISRSGKARPSSHPTVLSHYPTERDNVASQRIVLDVLSPSCDLPKPCDPEDSTNAYQVVKNLLITDFGYTEDGQRPSEDSRVTTKLKNALEHLSTSLYGSDVHFVMELVQNADDNTYNSGVQPTIKFKMFPHCVLVYNNEVGFQMENIAAICGVGGSTKKGLAGYIGQKGIGFKSVFTISHFPELHSNGYHIGFDRDYMIEPIWLEESATYKYPSRNEADFETCFRLQLDEKNSKNVARLTQKLDDACDDKLLLFLNRLEKIIFEDHIKKKKTELSKIMLSQSWSRIISRYDHKEQHFKDIYWCTIRKQLHPTILRSKNQKVESTEIALALKFVPNCDEGKLSLDTSCLLPVYAFLPTKSEYYRFILQGDFLLSTSRESLLLDNDWNIYLFQNFCDLFISLFQEMNYFVWNKSHIAENCPILAEVFSESWIDHTECQQLTISPQDLLDIIPVVSSSAPDIFVDFAKTVTEKVKEIKFIKDSTSQLCSPQQFVVTSELSFDPSLYLPEEFLMEATGYRYLPNSMCLSEELSKQLHMQKFDEKVMLKCFDYFSLHLQRIRESPRQIYWKLFSGLLLCLHEFFTPQHVNPPKLLPRSGLKPSQVIKRSVNTPQNGMLPSWIVTQLKQYPIWPTTKGIFLPCDTKTLFIKSTDNGSLKQEQMLCVSLFEDEFLLIFDSIPLFSAAKKHNPDGPNILTRVFSANFKGSIEELQSSLIIRKIILPCYASYNLDDPSTHISREIASAFLGFLYFSHDIFMKEILSSGIVVPTFVAKPKKNSPELHWQYHQNIYLQPNKIPEVEIHLGLELSDSVSHVLSQLPIQTALRQMKWLILDPMVSALIFKNYSKVPDVLESQNFLIQGPSSRKWKDFLVKLGLVNFFGIYRNSSQEAVAPTLFSFLTHLTRNHSIVYTDKASWEEADKSGDHPPLYCPYFLPSNACKTLYSVSHDVFVSLKNLSVWIINELVSLAPESTIATQLSLFPWFPAESRIDISMLYRSQSTEKLYFLAAPREIFSSDPQINVPHCLYIPSEIEKNANLNIPNFFGHFSDENILYTNLFCWMSSTQTCFASLSLMNRLYKSVYEMIRSSPLRESLLCYFQDDKPILWIPNSFSDDMDPDIAQAGSMWKLSKVTQKDPTEKFGHSLSQIRVLSRYYPKFFLFFRRVCDVCKAYEGLFGTHGHPLSGDRRIYEQSCYCDDHIGFGHYLPTMKGLVRTSPNCRDMLDLMIILASRANSLMIGDETNEEITDLVKSVKELLTIMSREIWKCFNIEDCIHGYNPSALREILKEFSDSPLLPTLNNSFVTLTSLDSKLLIAVDDVQIYNFFQEEIAVFESKNSSLQVYWIDGSNEESTLWHEEYISDKAVYSIDEYESSFRDLFRLSENEFRNKVTTIPPQTFFAPQSILPLLKYLNIPTLSKYTTSCWVLTETTRSNVFVTLMNSLLVWTQGFFLKYFDSPQMLQVLTLTQRIQRLLTVKVFSTPKLHRLVNLEIPQVQITFISKALHEQFYMNIEENKLYLDSKILYPKCCEIAIFMICKAVKIEIGLLTSNQQFDFMNKLRELLQKYSKVQNTSVESVFDFEDLPPLTGVEVWTLTCSGNQENEVSIDDTSSPPIMSEEALKGFDQLRNKERSKEKPTIVPPKSKGTNEASEKYHEEKALRNEEMLKDLMNDLNLQTVITNDNIPQRGQNRDHFPSIDANIIENIMPSSSDRMSRRYPPSDPTETPSVPPIKDTLNHTKSPRIMDGESHYPRHPSTIHNSSREYYQEENGRIDCTVLSALIEDAILQNIIQREIHHFRSDKQSLLPQQSNLLTGRIGEGIAYHLFRQHKASPTLDTPLTDLTIQDITWINEREEQYLPHDLVITYEDGKYRYCEVKTRLWEDENEIPQWFISPTEIEAAIKYQEDYFTMLIALKKSNYQIIQANILGYEHGLIHAMKSDKAHLLIQLSPSIESEARGKDA